MKKEKDLFGYKVKHLKDEKKYTILDFPNFPQETMNSRIIFSKIERDNFYERDIHFPIHFNITERIIEIEYKNIEFFTIKDLFRVIEKDKDRFINTDTFFKVKLFYENKCSVLSITYYTITNDGSTTIENINDLLDFIFIYYDKKNFTKKFIKKRIEKNSKIPNDIEYIPLIPLLWLDFDECGNLKYFNHFREIEELTLPF
jgi:hypothetical protein